MPSVIESQGQNEFLRMKCPDCDSPEVVNSLTGKRLQHSPAVGHYHFAVTSKNVYIDHDPC